MAKKKDSNVALEDQILQLKQELAEQKRKHKREIEILTQQHESEMRDAVANAAIVTVGMLEERLDRFRDEISTNVSSDIEDRLYRLERNVLQDPDEE